MNVLQCIWWHGRHQQTPQGDETNGEDEDETFLEYHSLDKGNTSEERQWQWLTFVILELFVNHELLLVILLYLNYATKICI
jgi:hypothetical protein